MKKSATNILIVVAAVLLCSVSMFGQAAQSSPQSGAASEGQPNSINNKDVELLRANLRANRKNLMAQNIYLRPVQKRGHQTQRRTLGFDQGLRRELQHDDGCASSGLRTKSYGR
jgi:hypothetical protein